MTPPGQGDLDRWYVPDAPVDDLRPPVLVGGRGRLVGWPLLCAVAVGVLSSAIPFALDLSALRRVTTGFFGVVASVHPVLAALAGLVLLRQVIGLHGWLGIALVVLANAVVVVTTATRRPTVRNGAPPLLRRA